MPPGSLMGTDRLEGSKGVCPPWSQDVDSCPAPEGEAGSPDKVRATVGRRNAKRFPLQVDMDFDYLKELRMINFRSEEEKMSIAVVLAMHGIPPRDFPKGEMMELFGFHHRLPQATGFEHNALRNRHDQLEGKMRSWPRTPENDPFHAASLEIARALGEILGTDILVGFNEFCAPTIEEAIGEAASRSPDKIIVTTPMMTRGGEHSERDIPEAIKRAQELYADVEIVYAWPYDISDVAGFLAAHIKRFE
jgi:sirohydrochlorin cobaltochelatase